MSVFCKVQTVDRNACEMCEPTLKQNINHDETIHQWSTNTALEQTTQQSEHGESFSAICSATNVPINLTYTTQCEHVQ